LGCEYLREFLKNHVTLSLYDGEYVSSPAGIFPYTQHQSSNLGELAGLPVHPLLHVQQFTACQHFPSKLNQIKKGIEKLPLQQARKLNVKETSRKGYISFNKKL
jgi:hypothetical protein